MYLTYFDEAGTGKRVRADEAFDYLSQFKQETLSRAIECAAITDPKVLPASVYTDVRSGWRPKAARYTMRYPLNGKSASVIGRLTGRLNQELFPRTAQRFGLLFDPTARITRRGRPEDGEPSSVDVGPKDERQIREDIRQRLISVAEKLLMRFQRRSVYQRTRNVLKSACITGGGLAKLLKGLPPRTYPLTSYVLDRDMYGSITTYITAERIDPGMMAGPVRETMERKRQIAVTAAPNQTTWRRDYVLYTVCCRQLNPDGSIPETNERAIFHEWQELDGVLVGDRPGIHGRDRAFPWVYVPWSLQDGAIYGCGKVEDHYGLHKSYEAFSEMNLLSGAASARRVKIINKMSGIDLDKYLKAPNLGAVWGDWQQIGEPKGPDYSDAVNARESWLEIGRQLDLVYGSIEFKPVERRTQEEAQAIREEALLQVGDQWSSMIDDLHTPVVRFYLEEMLDENPELFEIAIGRRDAARSIYPQLTTGLEQQSRDDEARRISGLVAISKEYGQTPLAADLDSRRFHQRAGSALGLDLSDQWKTPDEKAKAMVEAITAQAGPGMLENAAKAGAEAGAPPVEEPVPA